jgi:hypothetical protein
MRACKRWFCVSDRVTIKLDIALQRLLFMNSWNCALCSTTFSASPFCS